MRKAVIRLDPDLEILLKLEARRQNRSLSDVVRRLLRERLQGAPPVPSVRSAPQRNDAAASRRPAPLRGDD